MQCNWDEQSRMRRWCGRGRYVCVIRYMSDVVYAVCCVRDAMGCIGRRMGSRDRDPSSVAAPTGPLTRHRTDAPPR